MAADILDPLVEYAEVFAPRFKAVAEDTFQELAADADVDVEANRETCSKLYSSQKQLRSVIARFKWLKFGCVLLWSSVIAVGWEIFRMLQAPKRILICLVFVLVLLLALLITIIHPKIKKYKGERNSLNNTIDELKNEAWAQMSPLNRLYDWDVLTRMMSKTIPKLEFDPYFTTQRLADLQVTYGWDESFNEDRSVVYSHSGLINGNPFVICRTKKMEMSKRTYSGSLRISWTTSEKDSSGRYRTVSHYDTLTASVEAPFPEYFEKTRLIFASTAAPDLIFYRKQSGLANRKKTREYKSTLNSLRNKSENLKYSDFAMLTNEEFEVAFDTRNRNNNQQYALLFTPLAQENMLKLLEDKEIGFGDDFDFKKYKMINTIIPNHLQKLDLDFNPKQYQNFDYDKAKSDFYDINAEYFKALYFSLAPLLCVPIYQQIRPQYAIYGHDMRRRSSYWEHEALANFIGQGKFKHPDCVTDCILKTTQIVGEDNNSSVTVYAHGYRKEQRTTYVKKWGRDGMMHNVPVKWDEYLPVTGRGYICIQEDNDFDDTIVTHKERLNHINSMLATSNLEVYRRHIASKALL